MTSHPQANRKDDRLATIAGSVNAWSIETMIGLDAP